MANFTIKQMSPQLSVADIERAISFYTEKLGFEVDFRYQDFYAGIIKNGYAIHLKLTGNTGKHKKHTDESPLDLHFTVNHVEKLMRNYLLRMCNLCNH